MKKLLHILPWPHTWLVGAVLLYLMSFLFIQSFSPTRSFNLEIKKLENYIHAEQEEFNKLSSDTALIRRLANKAESLDELKDLKSKTSALFVFSKSFAEPEVLFWSSQKIYPPDEIFNFTDTAYFTLKDNGYYICSKKTLDRKEIGDSLLVIGMIPVEYRYFAALAGRFVHNRSAASILMISWQSTDYPVKGISGNTLFYVSPQEQVAKPSQNFGIVLKLLAVLLLLIYIHSLGEKVTKQYGIWKGLLFLVIALVVLRLFNYYSSFPINLRQFELFDPGVYGSNRVHKSLGDLLINAIFFWWIILFAWQKLGKTGFYNLPRDKKGIIIGVAAILLVVGFTFLLAYIIRSLAADSSISFDVINVFSLSIFSVFGFITLAILAVGYYYFMRIMVSLLSASFHKNFYLVYLVIAVAGLSFLTIKVNNPLLQFYIIVLGWLVFYTWLSRFQKFGINNQRQTMAAALFWIFVFSVSITAVIIDANREKEWQMRISKAARFDRSTDPYNGLDLKISFSDLDNDWLAPRFYRFKDESSAMFFRDSIMHKHIFLDHYDTRLFVFDANKEPLFNEEKDDYNKLDAIFLVEAEPTRHPPIYYFYNSFDKYTFIFKQTVTDDEGKTLGYLFILADPEKYNTEGLEAVLFKGTRDVEASSEIYSYGIYKNRILSTGPYNKYPFPTVLDSSDIPASSIEKKTRGDATELWYKASMATSMARDNEKIVVIARDKASALEAITLFSYIFCIFLFLVGFLNLLILFFRIGGNIKELRNLLQWNIRTQIHGTIIFISILSFVIIGIATISFFIFRYNQNNSERLSRTMEIMIKEMEKKLDARRASDDLLPIYDSVSNEEVVSLVNDVAEIHNVTVNVYDTSGHLHVTSQPIIYREKFLSKKMDPLAFYHLNRQHEVQRIQQEKLENINYISIYAPLRGQDDGIAYAYINIPFFTSQQELNQEISNFLVTIINLNAFIFLIAGVIALFITNRVTRSFLLISEKMKEVNLGKTNEEIEWKRSDEIGGLVTEYNKMVKKLEVSAEALARSEREGAWREMARQVAHEIKNPLTPMKLSIQFLQKAIDNNSANVKELTAQVAKTLVEQIDHLSKIAFDFSQFANIGNTNIETFDINEVIRSLNYLYKTGHEGELKLNTVSGKILVRADKTQMNRLFTNLIQNAFEACDGKEKCKIELNEVHVDGVVQISIKDNGAGIPTEMQSKIFVPNFTTKSSGTGLGLAMCKGIAEQAGGRIWFETKKDEGSIFYVELPVVNQN
ncbi:MAG TPA: ATP-binding protein [Chitinophagaceae bacterium]|nr:ATP-binding protein [Chitinophagaceae bacterium]